MGLLDDAIRQHLELKRRHGADPSEVARQEQEALGAPARGTAAEELDPADRDEVAGDDDPGLYDDEFDGAGSDDERDPVAPAVAVADPPELEDPPELADPTESDAAVSSVDQPTRAFNVEDLEEAEPEAGPDPGQEQDPGAAAAPDPERDPEARAEDEDDDGSEDVLEETPEFLQETPEHDRLWFEQKPPRDFDF